MNALVQMHCTAPDANSPRLTQQEIEELKPQIPEWQVVERDGEKRLERVLRFPDFAQALAFTMRVGELAEEEDHHPQIILEWGKVTVDWWTHKVHGLHRNDFIMAAKTDLIYSNQTVAGMKA